MARIKGFFILVVVFFLGINSGFSQTLKGYTEEEIKSYTSKVEDQVRFLEYLLNTIGAQDTPTRDKDVIIRESYLKIFRDGTVQVEDDLLLDRKVVINKDITAYMKDIEFFYQNVAFQFKIRDVKPGQKENGDVFFVVSLDRTIEATGKDGVKVNNTKPRFVEVNLDEKSQELKIVSIYTTKLSRDEELLEWWEILDPHWKSFFRAEFSLSENDSINLDLLYRFVSMDSLDISGTDSLLNLSPLESLRDLRYVDLSDTRIMDLGPISNVTFLEYLDVSNTPTSDIQFIKYSDRLKSLNLSGTQIQEIDELQNLKSLKSLKLVNTPIVSYQVLNEFDSLESLDLTESGFNNAENIQNLKQLKQLTLKGNYLINFSNLSQLKSLKYLDLSRTNIQDLTPLVGLEQLETVDLTGTEVADISGVNGKPNLRKVLADETKLSIASADNFSRRNPQVLLIHHVKDLESWWSALSEPWKNALRKANPEIRGDSPNIEILTSTIGLEKLDLSGLNIETLKPITRFVKLQEVDFSDNPVSDLLPLSEVKTLTRIQATQTQVRDLNPLANQDSIQVMNFAGSPVESILPVIGMSSLSYLNVDGAAFFEEEVPEVLLKKPDLTLIYRVEELNNWWDVLGTSWKELLRRQFSLPENPSTEQLHNLTGLAALSFERVSIPDLVPLKEFVNLRKLSVFDAPISDISALAEMKLLEDLSLSQMPVVDFSPLSGLFQLQKLNISNTGIEDLTPLASLLELRTLNISGTNLKSLKGLENLIRLEELDVASTNLRSLRPIEGLQNLQKLSCFNTRLTSRAVDRFKEINPNCEVRFY
ncbi:leucine-rich repeat domain-containing protein [Algoriphagus limi]|uniref:Leucine-rich repeat domain-containing protein n=1 Tax=Algoriphagus limi TaxID=2975273 RepID=A0ABT2G158_9BACT|nr:leucine-rich repeat domain-containing protein [Algoriphagus limi]MCS5489005.1 leucine-rich repeat domain-containing protein [Algoriphagus limi]